MKKNMGSADRIIRLGLAIIIMVLYFTNMISGNLALGLLIVASLFIITSLFGFCPLYFPFGISTKRKLEK